MRLLDAVSLPVVAFLLGTAAFAEPVTFSDTTFNAGDWNALSGPARSPYIVAGNVTPTMSVTQSMVPGSPSLLVSIGHLPGSVTAAVVNNVWSYSPATSGRIDTIGFRVSEQWRDGVFDLPWRLLVVQNGRYYASKDYYRALEQGGTMNQYEVFTATGLTSESFYEQTSQSLVLDPFAHPVFDVTGSTMRFGWLLPTSTSLPGGYTWLSYFGEYSITLDGPASVPEIDPAVTASVLAIVAGAFGLRERGRSGRV